MLRTFLSACSYRYGLSRKNVVPWASQLTVSNTTLSYRKQAKYPTGITVRHLFSNSHFLFTFFKVIVISLQNTWWRPASMSALIPAKGKYWNVSMKITNAAPPIRAKKRTFKKQNTAVGAKLLVYHQCLLVLSRVWCTAPHLAMLAPHAAFQCVWKSLCLSPLKVLVESKRNLMGLT